MKQHYRRLGDGGTTAIIELLKAGEKKVMKAEKKPGAAPAPIAPAPVAPAPVEPPPAAPETAPATS